MRFSIPADVATLATYLPRFLALVGEQAWQRRWNQLGHDFNRSPSHQKIGADYHWLELLLSDQVEALAKDGRLEPPLIVDDLAVLHFVAMVVEVHARLTPYGQNVLQGRLRSALSAETGFAAPYLELDIARRLLDAGNDVEFPDLEGTAQYDLLFTGHGVSGEVECKSQSADAGRKIHRKDFYRFLDKIETTLMHRAESGAREVLLITLSDRLPSDAKKQRELVSAVQRMTADEALPEITGEFFSIRRQAFTASLESAKAKGQREFRDACIKAYGERIHAAGPILEQGRCIIAMRSVLEDDISKPWLEAMQKAATQFSGSRPSFIAMQFNDLAPNELLSPSLRRRAIILTGAIICRPDASHIAAILITPYRGLVESAQGIGAPSFGVFNLESRFAINPAHYPTFYDALSDRQFAKLIGAKKYRSRFVIRLGIAFSRLSWMTRNFFRKEWPF